MSLPANLLHERPGHMQSGVRDEMNHRLALVATANERHLRGQLSEHPRRVASTLTFEAEQPCGRELCPVARALHFVQARIEEAHPHFLAGEL